MRIEHNADSYNQVRDILIGSYVQGTSEWNTLVQAVNRGIDSRLKEMAWSMNKVTDKYDDILGQTRTSFYVKDTDSFAVLLYRLDEMHWQEQSEDSENEFNRLVDAFLGMEEPLVLNIPWIRLCPNCKVRDPELQDGVYNCYSCDWEQDFNSSWPYLHWYNNNEYHHQMRWARIDLAVSMLFKRNDFDD